MSQRALFTALLLACVAVLAAETMTLSPMARLVPLHVIVPTLGLLGFQLVRDLLAGPSPEAPPAGEPMAGAWLLGAVGCIGTLGFLLGVPLYTILYVRYRGAGTWRVAAAMGVGGGVALAALFQGVLKGGGLEGWAWRWLGLA